MSKEEPGQISFRAVITDGTWTQRRGRHSNRSRRNFKRTRVVVFRPNPDTMAIDERSKSAAITGGRSINAAHAHCQKRRKETPVIKATLAQYWRPPPRQTFQSKSGQLRKVNCHEYYEKSKCHQLQFPLRERRSIGKNDLFVDTRSVIEYATEKNSRD